MALSADGRKIAFDATYKYEGGLSSPSPNGQAGLFYAVERQGATPILRYGTEGDRVNEISWSADSTKLVYGWRNRIYVFSTISGVSAEIASGSDPSWSPDGRLIAFRSLSGSADVISVENHELRNFLADVKIMGAVHWSPDSKYVMVGQGGNLIDHIVGGISPSGVTGHIVIYRVADKAKAIVGTINTEGYTDRDFYWVSNLSLFLRNLAQWPTISPCTD